MVTEFKFNIDEILKPYKEGGTVENPVERTINTISNKLIDFKFSPETIGAAIFLVFFKMTYKGLRFEGNENYGSKGAELFSCIKEQCLAMKKKKAIDSAYRMILENASCVQKKCFERKKIINIVSTNKQNRDKNASL